MCTPTYFPSGERAYQQWNELKSILLSLGYAVETIEAQGPVHQTLAADGGIVIGNAFVPARFRNVERVGEESDWKRYFEQRGFFIPSWYSQGHVEGGDLVIADGRLWAGVGPRSDEAGAFHLTRMMQLEFEAVHLIDPKFTHLDKCFTPVDEKIALIYPDAIAPFDLTKLERDWKFVIVERDEALRFACNALVLDRTIILPAGVPNVRARLESLGFKCIEWDGSAFTSVGGGPKSLVLKFSRPK